MTNPGDEFGLFAHAVDATAPVSGDGVVDPREPSTALGITCALNDVVRGADGFGVFRM
jgi:hypothetical protein